MNEWIAYNSIEPVGELRGDYRIARLTMMVAAIGGAKNMRLENFMPFLNPQREPNRMTAEEVEHILRTRFAAHNASKGAKP